jgi:hypothetical protein
MPAVKGTALGETFTARGAACGDLFNSGRMEVVINQIDRPPALLRNADKSPNHWVGLRLIGGPHSPRDAVGATVYLTAGGIRQRADVMSGGSYASSHDQRPHFGLGPATAVDNLEIHWPDRIVEQIRLPAVDRFFTIEQGKGIVAR